MKRSSNSKNGCINSKKKRSEDSENGCSEDLIIESHGDNIEKNCDGSYLKEKKFKYPDYFEYFEKEGKKFARCKLCNEDKKTVNVARTQGNTKGMRKHLERFHEQSFFDFKKVDAKQKKLTDMTLKVSIIYLLYTEKNIYSYI